MTETDEKMDTFTRMHALEMLGEFGDARVIPSYKMLLGSVLG